MHLHTAEEDEPRGGESWRLLLLTDDLLSTVKRVYRVAASWVPGRRVGWIGPVEVVFRAQRLWDRAISLDEGITISPGLGCDETAEDEAEADEALCWDHIV